MDVNVVEQVVWQKWTLIVGKSALTLAMASQLSTICWKVIAPEPVVLQAPSQGQVVQTVNEVQGTAEYHLFGVASNAPVSKPQPRQVEAPVTRLRLELHGVTEASTPEYSSAIVAQKGKSGEFFRVGDKVQGRTILQAVYHDRVMLETSGKLETLKFDERHSLKQSGNTARTTRDKRTSSRSGRNKQSNRGSLKERFSKVRSAADFVDVASSEINEDPLRALDRMGLEPQGGGSGYRVSTRSPLRQFQLKPGDIVLSLNGQTLGDPSADQAVLGSLDSSEEVRIEVQRGNRRFTVNHRLD